MKKLLYILPVLLIMSSCATTKEVKSSRAAVRNEEKLAGQVVIKNAVESRRYIVKLDKIYVTYGGMIDLVPRANYIIIDGEKAIISAAYMGRQYDSRPISGISIKGASKGYELTSDLSKGVYKIKMKVDNGSNSFDLYLTIGKNGSCSASLTNIRIASIRYRGYVVPITEDVPVPFPKSEVI